MAIDTSVLDRTVPQLAAEWRHFAEKVFPGAPADQLAQWEMVFFLGMYSLQRLQDQIAEACASGDEAAMRRMKAWRDELFEFGERRMAEFTRSAGSENSSATKRTVPVVSKEEKLAAVDVYHRAIREAFAPWIAGKGKPGMVAARAFFTMRHKDGTLSGSHTGLAAEPEEGDRLRANIPTMLFSEADLQERYAIKRPLKT